MTESKKYTGGCHCGKVRYEVELDLSQPVVACNCSICNKMGSLLTFVPSAAFRLQSGEGELTDYQFNKKHIHHVFCKICGIRSFARGTHPTGGEMVAVNTRCLDGVDVGTLTVQHFDGASM